MAKKLTAAERIGYGERCLRLSVRGHSNARIAEQLGLNRRTVANLLGELIDELDPDPEAARAASLQTYRETQALCWQKINASGRELAGGGFVPLMSPHGLAGLVNCIQASQREIDKMRGVAAPERVLMEHEVSVKDIARRTEGTDPRQRLRLVDDDVEEAG